MWWHGFAVQDARPLASKGFRPPFGLGRVTLERPKVTKGLLPRQSDRYAVSPQGRCKVGRTAADGTSLCRLRLRHHP